MISLSSLRFRWRRKTAVALWRLFAYLPGEQQSKANLIKWLHEAGFWFLPLIYLVFPALRLPILVLFFVAWLSQVVLGVCIVTVIERLLSNDRSTIMDPWLRRFGLPCTHRWRMRLTLFASSSALLVMLLNG